MQQKNFSDWVIENIDKYSNPEQAALLAWNYQQERINKLIATCNKFSNELVDKEMSDE